MGEREAHDRVAGLQQREVHRRVRLRAGVRLDVGVLGAEQRLGAVDRELLDDVDVLAAAVVALAGIALGVLVREDAALALQDRLRDEVLRRDHLERALLAVQLARDDVGDLGVDLGQRAGEEVGGQFGHAHAVTVSAPGAVTARPAQRRRRAATAPARTIVHAPSRLEAAQVDHGRRRARQRPPSSTRSAASRMPAGTSATAARRAAGAVGAGLQDRPVTAPSAPRAGGRRERAGRASPGRRRTRAGSAARGWRAAA